MTAQIKLSSLAGLRALGGVGRRVLVENESQQVALLLDGIVYVFSGSGDGAHRRAVRYRDSIDTVTVEAVSPVLLSPIDPPLVVEVRHTDKSEHAGDGADMLYLIDERTGLCVLQIGTDNIYDWYPSMVFSWQPEGWMPKWLGGDGL